MSKHQVIDAFILKQEYQTKHQPGVVIVLDATPSEMPQIGTEVGIVTPSGKSTRARVDEVKRHGASISLYFVGKTMDDIPKGSSILLYPV